jgi:signal transduction histidine kinase
MAVMSHELRTPLNAIVGYVELLTLGLRGPLTTDQQEDLTRVRRSATELLQLINQVLEFERMAAGGTEVLVERTDLADLLRTAAADVGPQAAKKGLQLIVETTGELGAIEIDAVKVGQIIRNLLSNAVKYTDRGEIRLAGQVHSDTLEISVRDTGIGILPEHRNRIFDPFWQANQRLTRKVGGSGLGLTIVQRLTQLMGGQIGIESTPGVGSTFIIRLPLAPAYSALSESN